MFQSATAVSFYSLLFHPELRREERKRLLKSFSFKWWCLLKVVGQSEDERRHSAVQSSLRNLKPTFVQHLNFKEFSSVFYSTVEALLLCLGTWTWCDKFTSAEWTMNWFVWRLRGFNEFWFKLERNFWCSMKASWLLYLFILFISILFDQMLI